MFSHRTELDERPSYLSLEEARNMGYVTCGTALAAALMFPAPIFQIPLATAGFLAARQIQRRLDRIKWEHERMSKTRLFNYYDSVIPVRVDEQGLVIPPDSGQTRWEAPMVPYKMVFRSEVIHDGKTERHAQVPFREIVQRHHHKLVLQTEFLQQYHPARRKLVETWWRTEYIFPALRRRHLDYDVSLAPPVDGQPPEIRVWPKSESAQMPTEVKNRRIAPSEWLLLAGRDHMVEFFEGVRIALQPEVWADRDDVRPSFMPYTRLRHQMRDLQQQEYLTGAKAAAAAWKAAHTDDSPPPRFELPPDPAVPDDIRIWFPISGWLCLGKGFFWDRRHAQRYYDLTAHDLGEITEDSIDEGDPRIYATGLNDERVLFVKERLLRQHMGLMGASGVGKTRALELIVEQAIRNGRPIFILDPKLDAEMLNRVVEVARLYGRGHKIHVLNFFDPLNPEGSTYNPLYRFSHVSDLGSRVGACVENTKDPFWRNAAIATSRVVCDLCHYVAEYLQLIGVTTEQGQLTHLKRSDKRIPELFLALQWLLDAKEGNSHRPEIARQAIANFHQVRASSAWTPTKTADRHLVDMIKQSLYSPVAWAPNFKTISRFGIGSPEVLLAWALKVTHFHIYGFVDRQPKHYDPNQPQLATIQDVVGSGGQNMDYMWAVYKRAGEHPLERRLPGAMPPSNDTEATTQRFFDEFVPTSATSAKNIERIFKGLRDALENMRVIASEDRKRFQETMSTLRASLSRLEGDRERVINSPDPDMELSRGVAKDEIYYVALSTLKDPVGSSSVAKAFCEDMISMVADIQGRYGSSPHKIKPFFFCGDELASWATDSVTLMLQQARSAGLHAILVGQAPKSDLEAQLNSNAKAKQVLANLSTFATLRLNLVEDQKDFADQVGHVPIIKKSRNIGGTPGYGDIGLGTIKGYSGNEGFSWQEEQRPLLPYAALGALPIGHLMMRSMGRQFCFVVGRLPEPTTNLMREHGIDITAREAEVASRAAVDDNNWAQTERVVDAMQHPKAVDSFVGAVRPEAKPADGGGATTDSAPMDKDMRPEFPSDDAPADQTTGAAAKPGTAAIDSEELIVTLDFAGAEQQHHTRTSRHGT